MGFVKLKQEVPLERLKEFGFEEDEYNCEPGDHYYHLNNYYIQTGDFRITVSTISKRVDILCLAKEAVLYNMSNLKPLHDLFASGLLEFVEKIE